jgi:hypothetical protein
VERLASEAGHSLDEDVVTVFLDLMQTLAAAKPDVVPRSALHPSR